MASIQAATTGGIPEEGASHVLRELQHTRPPREPPLRRTPLADPGADTLFILPHVGEVTPGGDGHQTPHDRDKPRFPAKTIVPQRFPNGECGLSARVEHTKNGIQRRCGRTTGRL
ncbi:hypothetical protein AAG570_012732 [Ranatra chinensis]|uniref:Uncharacterized protein n=1 Tax=Ranatra chinensis TaxID=642074 RepID=A0ABD0Z0Y1_9HEMI